MSDTEKVLPSLELGSDESKKKAKTPTNTPATVEKADREYESETESQTDSDSDLDSDYECKTCDVRFSGFLSLKQHQKGKKHAKMVLKKKQEKKLRKKDAESDDENDEEFFIAEPYADCKVCNKQFSGPEGYILHLKSKAHKNKVTEASILEKVREKGEINADKLKELYKNKKKGKAVPASAEGSKFSSELKSDEDSSENDEELEFECKDCEKVFSGLTPFTQHLLSKTHEKQLEKKKLMQKVISEPSQNITSVNSEQSDISTLSLEDDILVCKACSTSFTGPQNAMAHMKSKNHAKNMDKYIRKLERKKEKEAKRDRESQSPRDQKDCAGKEGEQISNTSDRPVKDESATPTTSDDKSSNNLVAYEKYKDYKDLMNSMREEDRLLQ